MVYIDLGRFREFDGLIYHLTRDIDQEFWNFGNFDFFRWSTSSNSRGPVTSRPPTQNWFNRKVNWIVVPHSVSDEDHHTRRFIDDESTHLTRP